METFITVLVLLLILGGAILYICRAKKRGTKCIGCPSGGDCNGDCAGCRGTPVREPEN